MLGNPWGSAQTRSESAIVDASFPSEEDAVPTFIALFNWTEQGAKAYKDSPSRAEAFNEQAAGLGVRLKDVYWTAGPYDLVGILEAADEESASAAMLQLASAGNVRTTTMRAYSSDEFKSVISKAG
jgi:uncharacterized protein with GYD domain